MLWHQIDFWFRDDDGGEASATGWGDGNLSSKSNLETDNRELREGIFRLRIAIKAVRAGGTITPRLEFKSASQAGDCEGTGWISVSDDQKQRFVLRDSPNLENRASTTQEISAGHDFIAGYFFESENPGPSQTLAKNEKTEYEWSLKDIQGYIREGIFTFRITNNGVPLDTYGQCPSRVFKPPSPGPSVRPTTVTFSGTAFPDVKIFVVNKDVKYEKIISQDAVTEKDGSFRVSFVGVLQSQQSFGLMMKDKEGRTTHTKFFNENTMSDDFIEKDLVVPPTVGFTCHAVTRGEKAVITGYASPGSDVLVELESGMKEKTKARSDGSYAVEVSTGPLEFGTHEVRIKQTLAHKKQESDFSPTKTFAVSRLLLPQADFSGDGRVDIKDWSIFLSRWTSRDMNRKKEVDLNQDGKIDISDFSLFIRTIRKK